MSALAATLKLCTIKLHISESVKRQGRKGNFRSLIEIDIIHKLNCTSVQTFTIE